LTTCASLSGSKVPTVVTTSKIVESFGLTTTTVTGSVFSSIGSCLPEKYCFKPNITNRQSINDIYRDDLFTLLLSNQTSTLESISQFKHNSYRNKTMRVR